MASTGVKEYTLRINGVTQSVKEVTTLESAVKSLDTAIKGVNDINVKAAGESKKHTKALTEEEKAAKKLADTQARIQQVNSQANREQIKANQALREKTRETQRSVAADEYAVDSMAVMGMQLTDLRRQYELLSAAERNEVETGGALLAQIQALDTEYKALRESTGNFRDSVGNYEKATKGLNELKDKFELAARGSAEMAANVAGSNDALDAFGATTNIVAKSSEQLAGVVGLATVVQQTYNAVIKENWIENKAAAIMDGVRAVQLRAKTAAEALSTKGTITATIAQRIFNVVANANPYVLLASALITVVGAIAIFASRTSDAAEKQKELNELQSIYLDGLERESARLKETGDVRVKNLESQLAVLNATGAKTKEIRSVEDQLAQERAINNAKQRGFYAQEIKDLDSNKAKLNEMYQVLTKLQQAQARGDSKLRIDVDLDGDIEKVKIEDAIDAVQKGVDNLGRTVNIATTLNTEADDLKKEAAVVAATRIKADKDLAKERAAIQLDATRSAEDARIALIRNGYERQRKEINVQYQREVQDLRLTLANELNLTDKARKAINDRIVSLAQQRNKQLAELDAERNAEELQELRAQEDARTALIIGGQDRQRAEINIRYDRQIEDLKIRLKMETDLTLQQQAAISDQVTSMQKARGQELASLTAQQAQNRATQELTALDFMLEKAGNKIGELTKRNQTGLKLIDVEGTRANLSAANKALSEYIVSLGSYERELNAAHQLTLSTLKEGTPEYIDELQKYAAAHEAVTQRVKAANKQQTENVKESSQTQIQYYQELFSKVAEFAQIGSELISSAVDTINSGLQFQLDQMNEELELLEEKYEQAEEMREAAVDHVESIEEQLQTATGGTADALREQLADAMTARNEAARNEQQLAKEKEKREADVRKKEKAMRRLELISNIGMSIANTAQGVTKGLSLGFPLGLVVAGIIAALGALQVGVMVKQLTKLAKGGPIVGPSHKDGGVPIGHGYEAEGGEYVVNKKSYADNAGLVEFINASTGPITGADLAGLVPGEASSPVALTDTGTSSEDRIVEAIGEIEMRPVVSVTDIMDVQNEVVTVQDLAGF